MATRRRLYTTIETQLLRANWSTEMKWLYVALRLHMIDRWVTDALNYEQAARITLSYGQIATLMTGNASCTWRATQLHAA